MRITLAIANSPMVPMNVSRPTTTRIGATSGSMIVKNMRA